jgi:RNA polymerase sigma factor (sigma-70 family)
MVSAKKPSYHHWVDRKSITQEQALNLLKLYRETGNPEYRNAILIGNMRFVTDLAGKPEYQVPNVPINDIIQEACIGFLKGIEKYDIEKGHKIKISSYALFEARGCIHNFIRYSADAVPVTDDAHRAYRVMLKRADAAEQEHQMEIKPSEMLIEDKRAYEKAGAISILTRHYSDPVHLNVAKRETNDYTRADMNRILEAGNDLWEPHRSIFRAYYGLSQDDYAKLIKKLGFTRNKAKAIIESCLTFIRQDIGYQPA